MFQVKERTWATAMGGPILSKKWLTSLTSKPLMEKSPRVFIFKSALIWSPLLIWIVAEHLLQPPSSQCGMKWKGSSCHRSSGSPLRSTWLHPCPRHGQSPKGRTVHTLKPCHSLHNLMLQQLGQHRLLVYFQYKSTGHSTPPGVHCILWCCLSMVHPFLEKNAAISLMVAIWLLKQTLQVSGAKISFGCSHHEMSNRVLLQLHHGGWPNGRWSPQTRMGWSQLGHCKHHGNGSWLSQGCYRWSPW